MILRVDTNSALPAYEQIRQQIVQMSVTGTLQAGFRLPSIRQLAADLGIAKGTVAHAYELLEAESVIESRGAKGSFVTELEASVPATMSLDEAAEAFVVFARQTGSTLDEVEEALRSTWDRI